MVGSPVNSCRVRLSRAAVLMIAIAFMLPAEALRAQLRTGRGTRSFYQERVPQPQHRNTSSDQVVTASYTDATHYDGTVMGGSVLDSNAAVVADGYTVSESIQTVGPNGSSDIIVGDVGPNMGACDCPECTGASMGSFSGCGASGCDGLGCNVCSGGFSSIAPTATAYCPSDCGPLMALWQRLRVRTEVPLYWRRDQGPPALVTSSAVGTDADIAGELGQNSTDILYGNGAVTDDLNAGIRLTFNTWLGEQKCWGLTLRYWNAGKQDLSNTFSSNDFPILARPFFNTSISGSEEQDTQLVAFEDDSIGSIRVDAVSEVNGIDLILRRELYRDRFNKLEWLWGYQNVNIDEGLSILSSTTVTGNPPELQGTSISVFDRFETQNEFNGMSYGLMNTRQIACWKLETMFRLGAGNLRRSVQIAGVTTTTSGGVSVSENQGLLARNSNDQPFQDDTFVVVPELALNLAYRIRPGIDFTLGYNYMVIPKVAQAAQQIDYDDTTSIVQIPVNLSDPLVGSLNPGPSFSERSYWLHSLGFGLQWRY